MARALLAMLFAVSIAASAQAELFGIFADGSNNDFLGAIDPGSGEVTTRGGVLNVGGRIGGVSDADPVAEHFFFVGAVGAASAMSIWTVDVTDGSVVNTDVINMTGFSSGPFCIRWDAVNQRLLAIMSKTNGDEVLATINPATGATAAIGAGFATGGLSSGVCAFDPAGQRLYLSAIPNGGSDWALFRINASTGAVLGSPVINTGLPVVSQTPAFLAFDDAGDRVLGVINLIPSSAGKVLVEIDAASGELSLLSDAIPAGGYSSGVSAFYQAGGALYFLANDVATNTTNTIFGVRVDGDVIADAALNTPFIGLGLTTSFLVLVPEPGGALLALVATAALRLLHARRMASGG